MTHRDAEHLLMIEELLALDSPEDLGPWWSQLGEAERDSHVAFMAAAAARLDDPEALYDLWRRYTDQAYADDLIARVRDVLASRDATRASMQRALDEAAQGKFEDLGSFAQFVEPETLTALDEPYGELERGEGRPFEQAIRDLRDRLNPTESKREYSMRDDDILRQPNQDYEAAAQDPEYVAEMRAETEAWDSALLDGLREDHAPAAEQLDRIRSAYEREQQSMREMDAGQGIPLDEPQQEYSAADIGMAAPCERCGQPGMVVRTHPSVGEVSPIRALCAEHEPEDDYT